MKIGKYISMMSAAAVFMFLAGSCVLEDRDPCPCWLSFRLGDCPESVESVEICGWRDVTLFSGTKSVHETHPEAYEWNVEKGMVETVVYSGQDRCMIDGYRYIIPEGEQADRLYLHRNRMECEDEFSVDTVVLHKEWVDLRMAITIDSKAYTNEMKEYTFTLISDIIGIDLLSEEPIYGQYTYSPPLDEYGYLNFRICRHHDGAKHLCLDVFKDGVNIDRLNLGLALEYEGFDWDSDSLGDIQLQINITEKNAFIEVLPWEELGDVEFGFHN